MHLEEVWARGLQDAARSLWKIELEPPLLEPPSDPKFGDAASSAPLRLARVLKKPPRAIAEELARALRALGLPRLEKIEVAGAGYINLTASPEAHAEELARILSEGPAYGRSTLGAGRK
ncbi:MAG TPA: arginine--tRNA ligase, partial [Planctomycetota bacterium]|nr:arginine--tRNA ligase [Planctomycetota bacterium]